MSTNEKDLETQLREFAEAVNRKNELSEQFETLERQIHAFEGSYLEDSQLRENIKQCRTNCFPPFFNPIKQTKKHKRIFDKTERIFSSSSITSMVVVNNLNENIKQEDKFNIKSEIKSEEIIVNNDNKIINDGELGSNILKYGYETSSCQNGEETIINGGESSSNILKWQPSSDSPETPSKRIKLE